MPDIFVSALFIDDQSRLLLARRKADAPPFAGQWVLPTEEMGKEETAEEALVRFTRRELRVTVTAFQFYDTLYLNTEVGQRIENVFVVAAWEGKLGYRTHGAYEVVRWFSIDQVPALPMPAPVRDWLVTHFLGQNLTPPEDLDQQVAWGTLSISQGKHQTTPEAMASPSGHLTADEAQLIGDVAGKRLLAIGCGDGQNLIAFAKQGAVLVGIDPEEEQVRRAQERVQREGVKVAVYHSSLEALPSVPDQSQDVVFSVDVFAHVERLDRCFAEVFRVLRPGGVFVFRVAHPFSRIVSAAKPWIVERSYWDETSEWDWDSPERAPRAGRQGYHRTVAAWFGCLRAAGFDVEAILEPPQEKVAGPAGDELYLSERLQLIPAMIIFKARKP